MNELNSRRAHVNLSECVVVSKEVHQLLVKMTDALAEAIEMADQIREKMEMREFWKDDARDLVNFLTRGPKDGIRTTL